VVAITKLCGVNNGGWNLRLEREEVHG